MSSVAKPKDGEESVMSQITGAILSASVFKPNQGRVVRQATFFGLWLLFSLLLWLFADAIVDWFQGGDAAYYSTAFGVILLAFWFGFRSVNIPAFTDFLIGVEAEMRKVTWPTRTELIAGAAVVLFVVVSLAVLMFGFDLIWTAIFTWLRVR
ncbi:MAG: preprotein translocase subunit SecE [Planctomycetaceae bacterium]|nr:preprotein translocase subunit SecE [Planctomycetaceae bacterium]